VHTRAIVKQRGMASVRVNVRLVVNLELFMQVLKGVQAGNDIESKFIDQGSARLSRWSCPQVKPGHAGPARRRYTAVRVTGRLPLRVP
jgi:hypothetical protein